jgi:ubiquinone/menaquinone biosynthesis C-methylase UbiE
MDAQNLDVPESSVRALYLQNCFHHLPDPEAFFRSSERALAPGGGIVMLEPHWGPIASLVYPRLFKEEGFDKRQKTWITPMDGPMRGANQALSYVVLKRDRKDFQQKFPKLKLVTEGVSSHYMRYVLTGGLNFPQLLPTFMFPVLEAVEWIAKPVSPVLGLHRWFVIRKDV